MSRSAALTMTLALCAGVAACEIPGLGKDDGIDKDPGAKALPATDCELYCKRQHKCFPGAVRGVRSWAKRCEATCTSEATRGGAVAAFQSAVTACANVSCGKANGECLAEKLVATEPKDGEPPWDLSGVPPQCMRVRACVDAQVAGLSLARRESARATRYAVQRKLFSNLRKTSAAAAEISCRMVAQAEDCAGAEQVEQAGAAIELDCSSYCGKQHACYPQLSKDPDWSGNCRGACEAEAKAGTTAAAFFASVEACKASACGDPLAACVAKEVTKRWPEGASSGWDMRGLEPSCMLTRACMEAGFHSSAPATARLTRKATYDSYRKVFRSLARDGGDSGKHCTTMASYLDCK